MFGWAGGANPTALIPEAEAMARRAIALDDQDPWAHLVMSCIYGYQRRSDDAIDEIHQALHINPNFSHAYAWLGVINGYAGKFDEAMDAIERAYRISPRDPFNAWLPVLRSIAHFTAGPRQGSLRPCPRDGKAAPGHGWRVAGSLR